MILDSTREHGASALFQDKEKMFCSREKEMILQADEDKLSCRISLTDGFPNAVEENNFTLTQRAQHLKVLYGTNYFSNCLIFSFGIMTCSTQHSCKPSEFKTVGRGSYRISALLVMRLQVCSTRPSIT